MTTTPDTAGALRKRAAELTDWCDRMSYDGECGPHWQRQFKALREVLAALTHLSRSPAMQAPLPDVNALAQIIRGRDAKTSAGELAERIVAWLAQQGQNT